MKAYVDSYVNYLLDKTISNSSQGGLPKTLEDKRKIFMNKGGIVKLTNAIKSLKENSFNSQMLLEKVRDSLNEERNQDINMRNAYQNQWVRMNSETLTQEYWKQVNGKKKLSYPNFI